MKEGGTGRLLLWICLVLACVVVAVVITHDYRKTNQVSRENNSSIIQLKKTVIELKRTKANIHQLQTSNCTLRKFLATARIARYSAAKNESGVKKKIDTRAQNAYTQLILALDGRSYCPLPKKLQLPIAGAN